MRNWKYVALGAAFMASCAFPTVAGAAVIAKSGGPAPQSPLVPHKACGQPMPAPQSPLVPFKR